MNAILFNLLKWIVVVGMGVITFMPTYGLVALNVTYLTTFPYLMIAFDLVWMLTISLVLPFGLHLFRYISSAIVGLILGLVTLNIQQNVPALFNSVPWYMWIVIIASTVIGWLLVASPLWRWVHTTVPVDNQSGSDYNHH